MLRKQNSKPNWIDFVHSFDERGWRGLLGQVLVDRYQLF